MDEYLVSYECCLNGKPYGRGPIEYMTELFKDYVEVMDMYGKEECSFVIRRIEKPIKLKDGL